MDIHTLKKYFLIILNKYKRFFLIFVTTNQQMIVTVNWNEIINNMSLLLEYSANQLEKEN